MLYVLGLGFMIGMRHALEADHIAAVASLAAGNRSISETTKLCVAWGLGHTTTLFLVGTAVLLADTVVPETVAQVLEFAVGVMLVVLGLDVLFVRRLFIRGLIVSNRNRAVDRHSVPHALGGAHLAGGQGEEDCQGENESHR